MGEPPFDEHREDAGERFADEEVLSSDSERASGEVDFGDGPAPNVLEDREERIDEEAAVGEATAYGDADSAALTLDASAVAAEPLNVPLRWDPYASAHRIGIELKRLENEVRELLEPVDPRRKRKLNGTRRWHELEDDLRALRYGSRLPEATMVKVLQLIAKRHSLYRRLSFLSSTRPTWNT